MKTLFDTSTMAAGHDKNSLAAISSFVYLAVYTDKSGMNCFTVDFNYKNS